MIFCILMIKVPVCFNNYCFVVRFLFFKKWKLRRWAAIKFIITDLISLVSPTLKLNFYLMPSCLLNSDHVNKSLILLLLATYDFLDAFFLGLVKYFALTIITWACQINIGRFINENLTKLICKKTLFRLKKPHNSTHLEPFAFNKFVKIKLSFYICLCLF